MSPDHEPSHSHHHPVSRDHREPPPAFARLLERVVEVLDNRGIVTRTEITHQIEDMEGRQPANGARIVARCWTDPDYRRLALENLPRAATLEGISMPPYPEFVMLDNTADTHHLVVCTLCSCYPRAILGPPPAWYKSRAYRSRAVSEPRAVLAEFGTLLPAEVQLLVVDSTADRRYLVLPRRPENTESLSRPELETLVNRDSMIGARLITARPVTSQTG